MTDSASTWDLDKFNKLGISYKKTPDDLKFFSEIIENKLKDNPNFGNVSLLGDTFVTFTNEYWKSSTDLNTAGPGEIDIIFSLVNTVEDLDKDLSKLRYQYDRSISRFLPGETVLRKKTLEGFASAFHRWMINLKEFFYCHHKAVMRWTNVREEIFTHLFTAFARISFFNPESGHMYNRKRKIDGCDVSGLPDLRFETYSSSADYNPELVLVSEVKQDKAFKGEFDTTSFSCDNITPNCLAQHGIELLLELKESLFTPNVFGCLCIGTKVIVTYLKMTIEQAAKIEKRKLGRDKATIHYSRPYDYMDVLDREDLMKLFFKFGFMQSEFLENIFKEAGI